MKGKKNIIKGASISCLSWVFLFFSRAHSQEGNFIPNSMDQEVSGFMRILATQEPPVSAFTAQEKTGHPAPGRLLRTLEEMEWSEKHSPELAADPGHKIAL